MLCGSSTENETHMGVGGGGGGWVGGWGGGLIEIKFKDCRMHCRLDVIFML